MPRGTLVIGVGGAGRGVVNYLKKSLEQEYGSVSNAGVVLYCIDGPTNDQYVLPGDYQLDTSEDSMEFYQLRRSPVDAIRTIAQGNKFAYIDDWLLQGDANRVPLTGIDPAAGMGGERVPGRVNMFLEVGDLEPELRRILTQARTYLPRKSSSTGDDTPGTRVNIFLVGSQSGGTGSGLLLDIAHLINRSKGRDRLIGVFVLPNSFSSVISEPGNVVKRDAKAFCGIRELHRFMEPLPTRIRYSSNVDVDTSQLFELCFLVDGQGQHLDLSDSFPLYGIVPSIADLIMATIKDSQHIEPNVINWIQSLIAPATTSEKFSTYGINTLIYPDKDLIDTFALRFAQEVYNRLLSPPAEAEEEGQDLALNILSSFKFGEMTVDLQRDRGIPTRPDSFGIFRTKIAVGRADAPFPEDPALNLEDVVRITAIFRPVTNAAVMQDCQNESGRYIGDSADTAPQTVWGWINYQSDEIAKFFVDRLTRCVTSIFYEMHENKYTPRPLEGKPYTIIVARDMLQFLMDNLTNLGQTLNDEYQRYYEQIEGGIQTDIIAIQRGKVDRAGENLMPGNARDKTAQREYILEYQKLLNLQVWGALMKGAIALAGRLEELTKAVWQMVGDPAQGWITFFSDDCQKRVNRLITGIISVRSKFADIKVRRYFPSPNDRAEQGMFHDFVVETGLINALLRDMHWTFESSRRGQTGLNPKQDIESFKLIMHMPHVPGFDRQKQIREYTEAVTGQFRRMVCSVHSPEEMVQFGKNQLGDSLSNLSIWDAIYYDYRYEWSPGIQRAGRDPNTQDYVDALMNDITGGSSPLLSQQAIGTAGGVATGIALYSCCLSAFRDIPDAKPDSVDELATVFHRRLREQNIAADDLSITKQIYRINYQHRIPLHNWRYYPEGMANYFAYLEDKRSTPIHLFPAERNAARLEQYLIYNHLVANPVTNVNVRELGVLPVYCMDISVVQYLEDMESFRSFDFTYAFELISQEEAEEIEDYDRYYVEIDGTTGTQRIYLGLLWNIGAVLNRFFLPNPQGQSVREKIKEQRRNFINDRRADSDWPNQLIRELREKADNISFTPVAPGQQDSIHRDDLKLAMQAVLYELADTLAAKQQ
ncbi:hypothetical protein GF312_02355 [Candidatus Poribacteria bacterium]|nr:hypothetical protein [Candidatus Poribacteria bacterium]